MPDKQGRGKSLLKTLGGTVLRAGKDAVRRHLGDNAVEAFSSSAAEHLVEGLDELKGAAMKFGQMLSILDESTLPPGWKKALSLLQASSTPKPWSEIEPIFLSELGKNVSHIASVNPVAVRAASIGQVHRGVLVDGRSVAIKIRYPGLDASLSEDIDALRKFFQKTKFVFRGDFESVLAELERVFLQELDLESEAEAYRDYAKALEPWGDHFVVPGVVDECSSEGVLTTEWLEGEDLNTWMESVRLKDSAKSRAKRDHVGENLFRLLLMEIFLFRKVQSDPNPANFLVLENGKLGLLDFGAVKVLSPEIVEDYRAISHAAVNHANADLLAISQKMGFVPEHLSNDARVSFLRILAIAAKPISSSLYDWGSEKLSTAVREEAIRFAMHTHFHAPPSEIVFLHRRILGTQLTLERLGPVVEARRIFEELVFQSKNT
jgi:aarF domain-containing kinase